MQVLVPRKFYDDHEERDLPTPAIIGEKAGRVYLDTNDPWFPELLHDAEYYADPQGFEPYVQRTICRSAQFLIAAVKRQLVSPAAYRDVLAREVDHDAWRVAREAPENADLTPSEITIDAVNAARAELAIARMKADASSASSSGDG